MILKLTANPKRMIHIYAMYLLAQFRETRAYRSWCESSLRLARCPWT